MRLLQVHSALGASRVAERGVRGDEAAHRGHHPAPQRQGRLREPRRPQLAHRGKDGGGGDDDGGAAGRQFNRNFFGLSFGLKNGLRFHFDSETCLNYPFLNIFLV